MTSKTWNATTGNFDDPARWSPSGVPAAGDVAIINAGRATATNDVLAGLTLTLTASASNSPALALSNSTLSASTVVNVAASAGSAMIAAIGTDTNAGIMNLSGTSSGTVTIRLTETGQAPGIFRNAGTINIVGVVTDIDATGSNSADAFVNDGVVSVWNPSQNLQNLYFETALTGTGRVSLQSYASAYVSRSVAATQTFEFNSTIAGHSILEIASPSSFRGKVAGFTASDTITFDNTPYTSYSYATTGTGTGTLTLLNRSAVVASVDLLGTYATSDFALSFTSLGAGQSLTKVTTTKAAENKNFYFTDTALGQSSTAAGDAYTGPVGYLQRQYLWQGSDPVAISATVQNVFLHGGSGNDALQVSGGQNVLDGGGGSNFLVGGTGAGSADTFYVDGTSGQNTWSTIVNFHAGDAATIFGFTPGVSTLPWTASDGAAGYTGATIHSELKGAGTGANGSITFAGVDLNTANAYFDITSGTINGTIGYLLIQYNATPHVSYTDTVTNVSATALATAYSGPVAGLQWQYLWSGSDAVAISAAMPNVFLHGGAGNDALAVTGGVNVLDGGGGSNFLVGGTGAGSQDTFFVDGTSGQNTWSTIVNFHLGDSATIFGFTPGVSTLPWTASDGAAGYTGATIHSELNGAGTGANGSITFAGLDLAAVNSHFTITSGTVGGTTGYLLIQYDH